MGNYLDLFPKVLYKQSTDKYGSYDTVTDLTFRLAIIKDVLVNFSAYYTYTVKDGETPEILADRFYGNPQAHWIILYANNIYDPQYDWPLGYEAFNKYIIGKYGSIETAQITWHHYEKVIVRENLTDNVTTETRFIINDAGLTATDLPYDTYASLETGYSATNIVGGKTVIETVSRDRISNYDWEEQQNEAKRFIKVIKKEFYPLINKEFDSLTGNARNSNLRRLV